MGVRGCDGCQMGVWYRSLCSGQKSSRWPEKGILSDRQTRQMWADSQSISNGIFVAVVLTFSAKNTWLINLLKAKF